MGMCLSACSREKRWRDWALKCCFLSVCMYMFLCVHDGGSVPFCLCAYMYMYAFVCVYITLSLYM